LHYHDKEAELLMSLPVIEFKNVYKNYRKHFWSRQVAAVVDSSFTVEKNTVTGFVGPNGAGKTTSIKMLLGLIRPTSGTVRINGDNPLFPSARKGVSFLSEHPYFYEHLTVCETLRFAHGLRQGYAKSGEADIEQALHAVELSASTDAKVKDLSKGMQQRLSMAQALLGNSDIFILDEPMSGLDPLGRRLFREILLALAQKGKTIFFSAHILDDVESVCSHVVVLSNGRLEYQGPLSQLLSQGQGGTDCIVTGLGDAEKQELLSIGCTVKKGVDGKDLIQIPAGMDPRKCQQYLCEKGKFCESVVKRIASLEEIIYKRK
jgi:ABC-2 type transport system ATP-binding protein